MLRLAEGAANRVLLLLGLGNARQVQTTLVEAPPLGTQARQAARSELASSSQLVHAYHVLSASSSFQCLLPPCFSFHWTDHAPFTESFSRAALSCHRCTQLKEAYWQLQGQLRAKYLERLRVFVSKHQASVANSTQSDPQQVWPLSQGREVCYRHDQVGEEGRATGVTALPGPAAGVTTMQGHGIGVARESLSPGGQCSVTMEEGTERRCECGSVGARLFIVKHDKLVPVLC